MQILIMNRYLVPWLFLLAVLMDALPVRAASIAYTDKLDRTVSIPVPVRRVVFLQMYELLPILDVWDRVVGVADHAYRDDLLEAVKPDIRSIPSVGSGGSANVEAILELRPDLVITWAWQPETVRFIAEKGIRIIAVYPENIEDLYTAMRLFGTIFQRQQKVETAIAGMKEIFSLIRSKEANRGQAMKRKMVYLGGKSTSVSGSTGINNDLMEMIGGVNAARSITDRNAMVSLEQLLVWNPEVIFIWGSAGYGARDILGNPQWRFIKAVREKQVYKLPRWTTWSPRLALVALWMAKKAYPEDFGDISFEKVAADFYHTLFHIPCHLQEPL
jgi:iron complex transport system substrate-binding protein